MATSKKYTIAVVGPASVSKKAITALLDDYLGDNDANFVIPVTESLWNSTIRNIAEYAIAHQCGLAVVTDDTSNDLDDDRALEIIELAQSNTKVQRVVQKLVGEVDKAIREGDQGAVLIAFDGDLTEGDDYAVQMLAMTAADAKSIVPLDLADALEEMTWDDDETVAKEVAAPEPEPEPEPAKPASRKRAAVKPAPEEGLAAPEPEMPPVDADPVDHATRKEQVALATASSPLSAIVNPMYGQVMALVDLIADLVTERVHQKLKSDPVPAAIRRRGRPSKNDDADDE